MLRGPATLAQIETMCRRLGLDKIQYVPGAKNRDRPGSFTPIGITQHITAGGLGSRTPLRYIDDIINGDPGVPVKANQVTDPGGTLWLNAYGNSNHCLFYGDAAYRLTQRGTWPTYSGSVNARGGKTKWSLFTYGNEMIAASKPTNAQRETSVILSAALTILHDFKSVVHGHGEVAHDRGFGDPNLDMGLFRRDVLGMVADYRRGPGDTAEPIQEEEDPMSKISRVVIPDPKTPHKLPFVIKKAGVWTPLPVGHNGWNTLVGLPSKPLHLWGDIALTVEIPTGGWSRVRFFAWDDKTGKRVYTWPDTGMSRMWEIARSISTVLNPGHRLGVEVMVSHPNARVTKARTEINSVPAS